MKGLLKLLQDQSSRSQLLFLGIILSLYLPNGINSVFIALFVLNSAFNRRFVQNLKNSSPWPLLLFGGFFAIAAASLLYTNNIDSGWHKLQTKLPFVLLPFTIVGSGIHLMPGFRKIVLNVFVWATLAAALGALINAGITSYENGSFYKIADDGGTLVKQYYFSYTHLAFFIMHPGYFSLYVSSAIFIGLFLLLKQESFIRPAWLQLLSMAFLFVFLILLQGRISILAFVIILMVLVMLHFLSSGNYWRGLMMAGFPLLAILLAILLLPEKLTRRFTEFKSLEYDIQATSVYDFNGLTLRLAEWSCAWDAIEDRPMSGYGLGDGTEALFNRYERRGFKVGLKRQYNSHNQYLETMLQTGVPGLLFLLAIFIWLGLRGWQGRDQLLLALSGLFFLSLLTETMLERQKAVVLFCSLVLYLALASKTARLTNSQR